MGIRSMKTCSKCKIQKEDLSFYVVTRNKSGLSSSCKECHLKYRLKNTERKKKYDRKYKKENQDKIKEGNIRYSLINKDIINKKSNNYYHNNKERCSKALREYREKNKEKRNKWECNKNKTDIRYRLANNLRKRLCIAIKNNQKLGSAVSDLGCSIDFLKKHLEAKFQEGMDWNNHGLYGWHVDHIKPLKAFDLENREEFLEACNYKNLQPLWAKDNLSKGSRYNQQGEINE